METLEAKAAATKFYVSQSNMTLLEEVLQDMNLKQSLKENVVYFTAGKKLFVPFHWGLVIQTVLSPYNQVHEIKISSYWRKLVQFFNLKGYESPRPIIGKPNSC